MSELTLHLLGSPHIERAGKPIEVDTRKAIALIAYLAVERGIHSRDALATLLWPDYDASKAHGALRRTLSTLNKALGGIGLSIDRSAVTIDESAAVWIDVAEFHRLVAQCRAHGHRESETCPDCIAPLTQAAALHRDDFLAGFSLRDSANFDDWQFFQTESLRRERAAVLERLVRYHSHQSEFEPGVAYARVWLAIDPLHEPAHRALMRLYAQSDQRAAALRQYQECIRILKQELDVEPLRETTELFEAIKTNRLKTTDERPTTTDRRPWSVVEGQYPLVGRSHELDTLVHAYLSISGNGHFAAMEGEAGLGKTRLAEEFAARVQSDGATVLSARGYEGETHLAHGLFVDALRAVIGKSDQLERLKALPALWLSEVARLLPELSHPDLAPAPPLDSPGAQSRFFEGIHRALAALCDDRRSLLLFDDVHWADAASLDLLTYLVRRSRGHPLFILVTWRSESMPDGHRLRALIAEAKRVGNGSFLILSPLNRADVNELVRQVIAAGRTLPRGIDERLYHESEGVPFFLIEYLEALAHHGAEDWSMPRSIRDLLRAHLASVDETGRQLLQTAAVIGRSFDLVSLREASGRADEEIVIALEALLARRLIRETDVYDFSHEKLRDLIYEETSLARRRLLHQRVANVLITRARKQRQTGAFAGAIAQHYWMAGLTVEAADYYAQAGAHARSLYANIEALAHFRAALAAGHPDPASLHEAIGDLQTLLGDYRLALQSYVTTVALQTSAASLARIEHKLGNVYQRQGEREVAEMHFEAALRVLGAEDAAQRASIYTDWSLTAYYRGQSERASELAQQALAQAADDPRALAQAHNVLGILARSREDYASANHHLEQSLAIAQTLVDPNLRIAALNNLALACSADGDVERALKLVKEALSLCASFGDRHREAALHNNMADLLHAAGRSEEAMSHLKQAVTIFAEIGVKVETLQPEIWKLTEW